MSKLKWSMEELDHFVALYRSHKCLWNQAFTDQKEKDAAYADIKEKMLKEQNFNLEIEEIKEKITKVRELFLDLKKKYSSCPPPEPNKSRWYADMEYVIDIYGSKLFDKASGDSEKTLPMSTIIQSDHTNSPLMLSKRMNKTSGQVCMSDGEEESKLAVDEPEISTIKQSTRIMFLDVLKKLYSSKVSFDYLILMDAIGKIAHAHSDLAAMDQKKLMHMVKLLGFIQKESICGQKIIVEKADQRFERYTYFTKIKAARHIQNRQIVYIDERIIDSTLGFEKVHSLMHGVPDETTIYYHALTRDGLLNGMFSNQATEKVFTKWVSTILMSYLKSPSLIIMDRGPLHGALEDLNPLTRYSTKPEMVKWLIDNNVPFNRNMSRPVLFELIKKYKYSGKEYKIDKIFQSHGHKVLRLPYTFPDLNLSHLFWGTVSESIPMLTISIPNITQEIIQEKIRESVHSISKTKKKWYEMEKLLILKENEIYQIDLAIENMFENYKYV